MQELRRTGPFLQVTQESHPTRQRNMSEKTTLLPSAPSDFAAGPAGQNAGQGGPMPESMALPMPRVIIVPGLEFDPSRKYRYGTHALAAALLVLLALVLVEMRDCNWGAGVDLERLQALHVGMLIFAFTLYLLSLFGIADFIFQYKIFFLAGALTIYIFAGLMVWMTYEAAVNPCVKTGPGPIDFTLPFSASKNVFSRGDAVGIIVLLLDIFATVLMISAASNFYRRY